MNNRTGVCVTIQAVSRFHRQSWSWTPAIPHLSRAVHLEHELQPMRKAAGTLTVLVPPYGTVFFDVDREVVPVCALKSFQTPVADRVPAHARFFEGFSPFEKLVVEKDPHVQARHRCGPTRVREDVPPATVQTGTQCGVPARQLQEKCV